MKWEVKEYTEGEPGDERKGYLIKSDGSYIGDFDHEEHAILACVAVNSDQAKTEALEAVKAWMELDDMTYYVVNGKRHEHELYVQVCNALKQSGL